ncbi:MAG TPA: hypothetical protein DDW68_05445, partial [Verrucomicrobiales bacterium]|nr:hypothetical protein [Verrucomicrobiales bacterium]
ARWWVSSEETPQASETDTLNCTQELVSGVLKQVSGRLEKAGERNAVMLDSLSSMDKSITSLYDVGERTITAMDGILS